MKTTNPIPNLNQVGRAGCPQPAARRRNGNIARHHRVRRDRDIAPYHRGVRLMMLAAGLTLGLMPARAVDFHVATAQDLQNALTLAAANGANNNIWLTNGYYIGNFNFNSSGGYNLLIANEPNVTNNTQITFDGGGLGRDMSLANTGTGNIAVQGITFLRNCGNSSIGALRIAAGGGATIQVQNCQFLSPTNTSGMGLEVASGLNATITNCIVNGSTSGGSSLEHFRFR